MATNNFNNWYDGAPVTPGDSDYNFRYWYDGAPVQLFVPDSNFTLEAETGSFSLTGNDASLELSQDLNLDASTGGFTLSGSDALFIVVRNYSTTASTGSFTLTGFSAEFSGPPTPPSPTPVSGGGAMYVRPHKRSSSRKKKQTEITHSTASSVALKAEAGQFEFGIQFVVIRHEQFEDDVDVATALLVGDLL